MNAIYEEYKQENPDELAGIRTLFAVSEKIERGRNERMKKKLELIERCKAEHERRRNG